MIPLAQDDLDFGVSTKVKSIVLIILCQVASMTLWFSASAAIPNLLAHGDITGQQAALLTGAVQLGFVAGTLTSAAFGLSDCLDPRRIFAAAAILGGIANLCLLFSEFGNAWTILLRFVTGVCMAGVYPIGMKLAAGWATQRLGLTIGALVAALTFGSALPNLFNALQPLDWRVTVVTSSVCALVAAIAVGFVSLGPNHSASLRFAPADALRLLRRRSIRLVNLGYLGHMWELYAMWAWIGPFMDWAERQAGSPMQPARTALTIFVVMASGAIGCLVAGAMADKVGRTAVTISTMTASGLCAATIGVSASVGIGLVILIAVIWGVTVIADSAQFSAAIVELSEPVLVGTMLTVQTCVGFLLTFVAIQLMPVVVAAVGWRYAFMALAIGPALGALAMWRLRFDPDAVRLAGGRK
jgi:MFS family permease